MEYVYETEGGRLRASDVPEVIRESEKSQAVRFSITFATFITLCLIFVASLVVWRGCVEINRAITRGAVDEAINSYSDKLDGLGVIGRRIQIFSPNVRSVRIHADGMWFENLASKMNGLTEVFLSKDRLIDQIDIVAANGSDESAKVIIRTDDGVKVWQEYKQLRPGVIVIHVKN